MSSVFLSFFQPGQLKCTTVERWIHDGEKQECRCWLLSKCNSCFPQVWLKTSKLVCFKHRLDTMNISCHFSLMIYKVWWTLALSPGGNIHKWLWDLDCLHNKPAAVKMLRGVTAPRSRSGLPLTTCFLLVFQRECFQISGVGSLR